MAPRNESSTVSMRPTGVATGARQTIRLAITKAGVDQREPHQRDHDRHDAELGPEHVGIGVDAEEPAARGAHLLGEPADRQGDGDELEGAAGAEQVGGADPAEGEHHERAEDHLRRRVAADAQHRDDEVPGEEHEARQRKPRKQFLHGARTGVEVARTLAQGFQGSGAAALGRAVTEVTGSARLSHSPRGRCFSTLARA